LRASFPALNFVLWKTIDALWAQEAEDRIDAFERGEMAAIPAEQVFAEIEKYKP
jgi:hypothetical protein